LDRNRMWDPTSPAMGRLRRWFTDVGMTGIGASWSLSTSERRSAYLGDCGRWARAAGTRQSTPFASFADRRTSVSGGGKPDVRESCENQDCASARSRGTVAMKMRLIRDNATTTPTLTNLATAASGGATGKAIFSALGPTSLRGIFTCLNDDFFYHNFCSAVLQHWIPAFGGMTGEADHRRLDALAGSEEIDRPLFAARGKLCGKSRVRSAATGIKTPPSVDVFLFVEGLAQAGD
jgi:hypothetical protein